MPISFTTREATADDLDDIAELFCEHNQYIVDEGWCSHESRNVRWGASDEGKASLKRFIPGNDEHCSFVALNDEGKTVGYLYGHTFHSEHRLDNPGAEIDNVYISYGYRCSGIGSALMEDFTFWCKDKGVKRIIVKTYADNLHARNVYEKEGMELKEVVYGIPL